jgi:hypothetical protein
MPFSFKPEISQNAAPDAAPVVPQASFGGASTGGTPSMMAREGEHGRSIVHIVLLIAFWGAAIIAAVLFVYSYYLNSQIEGKKATLASYESRLASLPLEDMRKLSNRIRIINQLLQEHPSANVAFRIIEDSVENEVTYKRFDLRYNESNKNYLLQLAATAPDYKSVAQQIDTFKRPPYTTYLQNVVVDGLQPDPSGKVGFTMKMAISVMGLQPEDLNLSTGAAERLGTATTSAPIVSTTTLPVKVEGKASTSPVVSVPAPKATSTPPTR